MIAQNPYYTFDFLYITYFNLIILYVNFYLYPRIQVKRKKS